MGSLIRNVVCGDVLTTSKMHNQGFVRAFSSPPGEDVFLHFGTIVLILSERLENDLCIAIGTDGIGLVDARVMGSIVVR
jgi:hypothetical protein